MSRPIRGLALAVVALSLVSAAAEAGYPYHGYGWFSNSNLPYDNFYQRERLPYYSLYPPVYYSYPVPRPYGWSPFAYPPGVQTPDILAPAPVPDIIENPYIEPAPEPEPEATGVKNRTAEKLKPKGKLVINPYVQQPRLAKGQ